MPGGRLAFVMAMRPDWWRQVVQWQRVRERGRSREGILKEPVMERHRQAKVTVRMDVDGVVGSAMVGGDGWG